MEASRRVVIALGSALGLSLLSIAFLLGRMTAPPAVVPSQPPVSEVAAAPVTAPTVAADSAPAEAEIEADPPYSPAAVSSPAAAPELKVAALPRLSEPWAPSTPGEASASPERQQVAAYFAQVDRLEDMGAGDPQAFATSMMQSLSSGDFTDFDKLLEKARGQKQKLVAIVPPPSCADHHRLASTLSTESVAMLERLKAALMKGDSMALMGIASDGKALEAQVNQLKTMGEAIKRKAGV